jgi:DNA-binding FadR family transcriptional regulator
MSAGTGRLGRFASDRALSGHSQVVRALGAEIVGGVLPAGTKLPPEADLLARFQISRTVLREVLKTLAAKGLISAKTRVGTSVLPQSRWNYFDPDVLDWKVSLGLDPAFRASLTEIRQAIEPMAAALAAIRRTPQDILDLRACVAAMRRSGHTRQSFAEADLAFHMAIGAASGNPLMRSIAAVIEAALVASFSLSSPTDDAANQEVTVRKHEAIVNAIEAGRPTVASKAMLAVIDAGVARLAARATLSATIEKVPRRPRPTA